jgi:hypothetical protein
VFTVIPARSRIARCRGDITLIDVKDDRLFMGAKYAARNPLIKIGRLYPECRLRCGSCAIHTSEECLTVFNLPWPNLWQMTAELQL